jgi:hypothetical protein
MERAYRVAVRGMEETPDGRFSKRAFRLEPTKKATSSRLNE